MLISKKTVIVYLTENELTRFIVEQKPITTSDNEGNPIEFVTFKSLVASGEGVVSLTAIVKYNGVNTIPHDIKYHKTHLLEYEVTLDIQTL